MRFRRSVLLEKCLKGQDIKEIMKHLERQGDSETKLLRYLVAHHVQKGSVTQ